jgi:putative aldouronate transport system substrate-binding protein
LTAFTRQISWVSDYIDNEFTKWYEDKTNIAIDWNIAPDSEVLTKLNLILTSGDYPDMLIDPWVITGTQLMIYGDQGVFIPLNKLIDEYGVEVTRVLNETPQFWGLITQSNNAIYALPQVDDCFHCKYPNKMWVYGPWLETLGLAMPATTDEFYNMLVAFRDQDPNGNGQQDEIPLAGSTVGSNQSSIMIFLMNSFIYTDSTMLKTNDNVVEAVFDKPQWREGIEYLRKLYSEGLLMPETFNQDMALLKQNNGGDDIRIGTFPDLCPWSALPSDITDERWINYIGVAPLKGPSGLRTARSYLFNIGPTNSFVITSACKYPEAAFRWADALYTQENTMRKYYGRIDQEIRYATADQIGINGLPAIWATMTKSGGEHDQPNDKSWAHIAPHARTDAFRLGQVVTGDPKFHTESVLFKETKNNYEPYAVDIRTILPPLIYTEQQSNEMIDIQTTINNYVNEMFARFITGDANIDSEWDSYISSLQGMNLERYLQIQQEAYDSKWSGR